MWLLASIIRYVIVAKGVVVVLNSSTMLVIEESMLDVGMIIFTGKPVVFAESVDVVVSVGDVYFIFAVMVLLVVDVMMMGSPRVMHRVGVT